MFQRISRNTKIRLVFFILLGSLTAFGQPPSDSARLEKYNQAETIFGEAVDLHNRGTEAGSAELRKSAVPKFEKARNLYAEAGAKINEAACLMWIGVTYDVNGENQKALETYSEALTIYKQIGPQSTEADILKKLGELFYRLRDYRASLKYYNDALLVRIETKDQSDQASLLLSIGHMHGWLQENQNAIDAYQRALDLQKQLGDKEGQALTFYSISRFYANLNESQSSLEFGEQALLLYKELGNKPGEAATLADIGRTFHRIGNYRKALEYFNQALPLVKQLGDQSIEAQVLAGFGKVNRELGENNRAIGFFEQVLAIQKQLGDKYGEAVTFNDLGMLFTVLGEYAKALDYFNRALLLDKELGYQLAEAVTLSNIGTLYSVMGNQNKALEYLNQALNLKKQTGDKSGEADTLYGIGAVYVVLGENQKALDYFKQVLPVFKQNNDKSGEAFTLTAIGAALRNLGKFPESLEFFNRALPLRRQVGDQRGVALTFGGLRMTLNKLNKRKFAAFYGKLAVNVYQGLRANIRGLNKETQQSYLKSVEDEYRRLTDVLIADGRLAEAQQVLNAFKDQQFFDSDEVAGKQSVPLSLTPREADFSGRYQKAMDQIGLHINQLEEFKRKLGNRQPNENEQIQLNQLTGQINTSSDEFSALLKDAEIEFSKPFDEKDRLGEVADTADLQSALRELQKQTGQTAVAVYTLVGEETFRALLITENDIKTVSFPIKAVELNLKALQLWRLLRTPKYDPQPLAKEVYTAVFGPLESQLPPGTKTILWSLDANLRYLPIAALHNGQGYLVERFQNVIFTRADKERLTRTVANDLNGFGFGSSRAHQVQLGDQTFNAVALPGVKTELARIFRNQNSPSGVIKGEVLLDSEFNRKTFLESMQKRRPFVHIASHFKFEPGDDSNSFLLLGDGSPFTLAEMKRENQMFGGVDLLTLSACETAAQRPNANGREVDGFAELAQRQGATAVMASLWLADDTATAELMTRFYGNYKPAAGVNKAVALQTAQLALLKGKYKTIGKGERILTQNSSEADSINIAPEKLIPFKRDKQAPFAHPYFWAQFILIGNWK